MEPAIYHNTTAIVPKKLDSIAFTAITSESSSSSSSSTATSLPSPLSKVHAPSLNATLNTSSTSSSVANKTIKTTSNQLLLKLDHVSVVYILSLAKLSKAQIACLREFKVYGGLNPTCTHELLHSGFYVDEKPETFTLRNTIGNGILLPIQYIKIVPGTASKTSMPNTWELTLRGICDPVIVGQSVCEYNKYRENEVYRLCLKHFRRHRMQQAFDALLLSKPDAPKWEHPLISSIYHSLVVQGDFANTETLLQQAQANNCFDEYVAVYPYTPYWKRILPKEGDVAPGMRGGHQMCIDEKERKIYLFGGWDGAKDLCDFWVYDLLKHKWELLCPDVAAAGGPGPRSCHKICFDEKLRRIYTLGRYVDAEEGTTTSTTTATTASSSQTLHPTMSQLIHAAVLPNPHPLLPYLSSRHHSHTSSQQTSTSSSSTTASSTTNTTASSSLSRGDVNPDFFYYEVDTKIWVKLSSDTHKDGGPPLIFDHQMVAVPHSQKIYVFGGKAIFSPSQAEHYSGLYEYNILDDKWNLLRDEEPSTTSRRGLMTNNTFLRNNNEMHIRSRIGHSMLYNSITKSLYIFAGQRSKDYLSDFFEYKIEEDQFVEVMRDSNRLGGPEGGFTQRATIDAALGEIYVLSGLMREKHSNTDTVKNSFWVYHISQRKWRKIYQNENTGHQYWQDMQHKEPRPRFAHQLVYDSQNKVHYMFGGNPGEGACANDRLDDFWALTLERPSSEFILSRLKFFTRAQLFYEKCAKSIEDPSAKLDALTYLREEVAKVVLEKDPISTSLLNSLPLTLFDQICTIPNTHEQRYKLFEQILEYFPVSMRPPSGDLTEYID